jgi:hypothetical protein
MSSSRLEGWFSRKGEELERVPNGLPIRSLGTNVGLRLGIYGCSLEESPGIVSCSNKFGSIKDLNLLYERASSAYDHHASKVIAVTIENSRLFFLLIQIKLGYTVKKTSRQI